MLQGVAKDFCFAYRIVFHKYVKRRIMENTAGNTSSNLATANRMRKVGLTIKIKVLELSCR
jgi:hypothetical protein